MMKLLGFVILLAAACQGFAAGVVAPDAQLEKRAGGFKFTEDPACDAPGDL